MAINALGTASRVGDGAAQRVQREVEGIERQRLTPLVRRALERPTLDVVEWQYRQISYLETNAVSLGLYRLSGTARDAGADGAPAVPWSLVLKVMRSPSGVTLPNGRTFPAGYGVHPSHDQYWRREIHAYRSALLQSLPVGLAAPRCIAIEEDPSGFLWLWLEEVADDFAARGERWPLSRYGLAARHFGLLNGAYLDAARSLPGDDWLSRGWFRQWVTRRPLTEDFRARLIAPSTWEHPMVQLISPKSLGERMLRSEERIAAILDAVDRLPSTLSHLDAYSRNLLSRRTPGGDEETVAIDWAFLGIATVGVESGQLVAATALFRDVSAGDLRLLDQNVFEGYV